MSPEESETQVLLPNLGGEEGPAWRDHLDTATVRLAAELWRLCFGPEARLLDAPQPRPPWPQALESGPNEPVFPWLAKNGGVTAWINTADAEQDTEGDGRSLTGPTAECVAAVHDKAFAHRLALEHGFVPRCLRERIEVFEPEHLEDTDHAIDLIRGVLAGWPAWARQRFTLKPRFGCAGRGRVPGRDGMADTPALRAGLARLARRGGAMLEPWLERSSDLSVQMHLDSASGLTLLGSLEQLVAPSGLFLGHRGEVDSRGRVFSGHRLDEPAREAAAALALAAAARGFHGPCGVDSFSFRDPERETEAFRSMLELNARFTMGIVAVALVRRALPSVRTKLDLSPGERLGFCLSTTERPGDRAPVHDAAQQLGESALEIPLADEGPLRPALLFARDPSDLDDLAQAICESGAE